MSLYHGTSESLGRKDIENYNSKKFVISIYDISRNKRYSKLPGSLGYGYYTFENDRDLAYQFGKKKYHEKTMVLEIELDSKIEDDNILDLNDSKKKDLFLTFAKCGEQSETAKKLFEKMKKQHKYISLKQNVFAGIMTELFVRYMKEKNELNIRVVRKDTETYLPPFDKEDYCLGIYNGTEVCIRDGNCIANMDMR